MGTGRPDIQKRNRQASVEAYRFLVREAEVEFEPLHFWYVAVLGCLYDRLKLYKTLSL